MYNPFFFLQWISVFYINPSLCMCAQGFNHFYSVYLMTVPRVCWQVVSTWYGRGRPSQPCTVAGHRSRQSSMEARPILVSRLLLVAMLMYSSGRNNIHLNPQTFLKTVLYWLKYIYIFKIKSLVHMCFRNLEKCGPF